MTRAFPFILIILFAGALYALYEPPQRQKPSRQPVSPAVPAPAVERAQPARPAPPPSTPSTARLDPVEKEAAREAPATDEAPAPYEPRALSLGRHKLSIIDGSARLEVGLSFRVTSRAAERQVRGLRRRILQMTYFLSSRRRAEGMRGPGGLERFRSDLEARVRNLVRSEGLERISLVEPRWIEAGSAESGE